MRNLNLTTNIYAFIVQKIICNDSNCYVCPLQNTHPPIKFHCVNAINGIVSKSKFPSVGKPIPNTTVTFYFASDDNYKYTP